MSVCLINLMRCVISFGSSDELSDDLDDFDTDDSWCSSEMTSPEFSLTSSFIQEGARPSIAELQSDSIIDSALVRVFF